MLHLLEVAYRLQNKSACTVLTVCAGNDPLQTCNSGHVCHPNCIMCWTLHAQVLSAHYMCGMAEGHIRWCRVGTVWLVALSTLLSLLPALHGAAIPYFWPHGR